MAWLITKYFLSAWVVVAVSEVAKRNASRNPASTVGITRGFRLAPECGIM